MMWRQLIGLVLFGAGAVFAADPVVEYVRISQRAGTKLVDIEYKVTDADGDDMTIAVSDRSIQNSGDMPVNPRDGTRMVGPNPPRIGRIANSFSRQSWLPVQPFAYGLSNRLANCRFLYVSRSVG